MRLLWKYLKKKLSPTARYNGLQYHQSLSHREITEWKCFQTRESVSYREIQHREHIFGVLVWELHGMFANLDVEWRLLSEVFLF